MLKIRDGIDLKELEKFGFEYYSNKNSSYYGCCYKQLSYGNVFINDYHNICIYNEKSTFELDDLYDLIKADLVEKVERK